MNKLSLALLFSAAAFAQTITVAVGNITVTFEQAAAYESWRMTQLSALTTPITLTGALDTGATKTFTLTGDLTQLAVGNEILIDSEMMPITVISGQNVTVTRNAYTISTFTISTPVAHTAGATVGKLKNASAVAGFKAHVAEMVWQVVVQYCTANPAKCPAYQAQLQAHSNADAAIAALKAGAVQ